MNKVEKTCLSCKFFRLLTVDNGLCRVDRAVSTDYPEKKIYDSCDRFQTCGQNYYIRCGWIKGQQKALSGETKADN